MSTVFWSPTWGLGELDYGPKRVVFSPREGMPPITIEWVNSRTGQANQKSAPRRKADREEWQRWLTFTSKTGEVFTFRRGGPPLA